MDLGDILNELPEDPQEQKRRQDLVEELNSLRGRLATERRKVSNTEILDGIRKRFDLVTSSDFLEDASWLIEALSFTALVIPLSDIPSAWRAFQEAEVSITPLTRFDYPILEGMAYWYFQNRDKGAYDEQQMLVHALAIYEYLMQQVWGWQASDEFADLFSSVGMHMFYLYYGLRNKERAKFYAQVLEMNFLEARLDDEDYVSIQELMGVIKNVEQEEESEQAKILQLQWNTITNREREIRERDERIKELERRYEETLTRVGARININRATQLVSKRLGSLLNRLHPETLRTLALAEAFSQPPLCAAHPDISPNAFFKAINTELGTRLFTPLGSLSPDILERVRVYSPVALLIDYGRNISWSTADRSSVREALDFIGKESLICSKTNLDRLAYLRHHRNNIEHRQSHGRPYSEKDLGDLLKTIWNSNWLIGFLRQLHSH